MFLYIEKFFEVEFVDAMYRDFILPDFTKHQLSTYLLLFMRDKSDRTPDIIGICVGGFFFKLDSYIV